MARKTIDFTIIDEGRDKGKVFRLIEWDAMRADKWSSRAALAVIKAGGLIPEEIMKMGIIGIFMVGIHRLHAIEWSEMEPLMDEMMTCVRMIPTPSKPNVVRDLVADDIEESSTYEILRKEVFHLHTNFTRAADPSKSHHAAAAGKT